MLRLEPFRQFRPTAGHGLYLPRRFGYGRLVTALFLLGFLLIATAVEAQTVRPLSKGWYRLPYGEDWTGPANEDFVGMENNGANNVFNNGHNGYDAIALPKQAWDSPTPHKIVAMADGRVVDVVDVFNQCTDSGLTDCNNRIWILHPNAEYSSYYHIAQGSARVAVNDCVVQGQHIADEGDVGWTSFGASQCDQPDDLNRPKRGCDGMQDPGGFAFPCCAVHLHFGVSTVRENIPSSGNQLIPRICGIDGHVIRPGITYGYNSGQCDSNDFTCASDDITLPGGGIFANIQDVVVAKKSITQTGSAVYQNSVIGYEAGERVSLNPGFKVVAGSYFRASIGTCNGPDTGCP